MHRRIVKINKSWGNKLKKIKYRYEEYHLIS
jgi:hypothetical protein